MCEQRDIGRRRAHDLGVVVVVGLAGNALNASFAVGSAVSEFAEAGLLPAQASAHLSHVVVVAHEELVVMDIVDVVSVHNAVLVGAGEREAVVGGANVSAARVESAKALLGEGRARDAFAIRLLDDVTSTLLAGTEQTGTRFLAAAGLGARAPSGPLGDFAVSRARFFVADVCLGELRASSAAVLRGGCDAAVFGLLAATTGLGAWSAVVPGGDLAVDGALAFLAALLLGFGTRLTWV